MEEQKVLTTPVANKQVIVRGYVTGRIDQEVQKVVLEANRSHFEADMPSKDPNGDPSATPEGPQNQKIVMDTDPTAQLRADNKLLELMLLSVDGSNGTDKLDKLLDLPKKDVDYVLSQVKEIEDASKVASEEVKKA